MVVQLELAAAGQHSTSHGFAAVARCSPPQRALPHQEQHRWTAGMVDVPAANTTKAEIVERASRGMVASSSTACTCGALANSDPSDD